MAEDIVEQAAIENARELAQDNLIQAQRAYEDATRAGDIAGSAQALRRVVWARNELTVLGGGQQPGSQFTQREQAWLNQRPAVRDNPQKLQEIAKVAQQLFQAGYQRDTDEFFQLLNLRTDISDNDILPSPDEAVKIAFNSKYADLKDPKEAAEAVNKYNAGVHDLLRRKAVGDYK